MLTTTLLTLFVVLGASVVLLDHARTESARLRLLVALAEELHRASGPREIAVAAEKYGRTLFSGCNGAIYLTRPGAQVVDLAGWWGGEPIESGPTVARLSRALEQHDPFVACLRLRVAGQTVGFLTFATHDGEPLTLGPGAIAFGDALAHALALVRLRGSLDDTERRLLTLSHEIAAGRGRDAA